MTVALTFDDGPDPVWTPRVLAALDACGARATFFVMGSAAAAHPGTVEATAEAGHDVQLHCHEHLRHTALTRAEIEEDTDRALDVLTGLGVEPTRWRTPWGVLGPETPAVAAARGLTLVGWTADTEDWAGEACDALLARVADELRDGAIVLAHDGLGPGALRDGCAETVALVAPLVAAIRAAGLEAGPVPGASNATHAGGLAPTASSAASGGMAATASSAASCPPPGRQAALGASWERPC